MTTTTPVEVTAATTKKDAFYSVCKRSRGCSLCNEKIKKGEVMIMTYKGHCQKPIANHKTCAMTTYRLEKDIEFDSFQSLVNSGLILLTIEAGKIEVILAEKDVTMKYKELIKKDGFYFCFFTKHWKRKISKEDFDPDLKFNDLLEKSMVRVISEHRSDGLTCMLSGDRDVLFFYKELFEQEGFAWNESRVRWCKPCKTKNDIKPPTVTSLIEHGELSVAIEDNVQVLFGNTFKHKDIIKAEGWIWSYQLKRWGILV